MNKKILSRTALATLLSAALTLPAMAEVDAAAQALLPEANKASGKLLVVTSLAYPPMEYTEAGSEELLGFDMDLAREIGARLGLAVEFANVEFPQLIPQVVTGRSEMIISAFSDKKERQAQLSFIDYFNTGNVFYSTAEHKDAIKSEADLCGKTIAVATGTSWVTWAEEVGKANCPADNLYNVIQIPTQAEHIMQIKQGRAQASVIGVEGLADLQIQEPDAFYQIGEMGDPNPYGIAFEKSNTGLRDAALAALNGMLADGTYGEIVARYHLEVGAVTEFVIDGAKN
ncbi:ABC transporter substrate-binding protein [Xinfangfangia sp. CPCC 101601]|uniref:ABC transporter substrate-binding protein n=1 Tax=Pseudogemmobacter lacusdianii TaxID=3069608 RepID=A0ABU0W2K2_9RHOB|nr:ABC transporter substrate-binding protein [Xinfangfangia sp. CPCC 101601]MDQ2067305.1 ABC transporter substrate-binding protein [Xinfangfangia sp. CPCC 101601]